MNDVRELAKSYLQQAKILQLATSANDEPWVCTVHFYSDENLNAYWVSRTDRHHSKQLAENPAAAATLVVHENTMSEDYVISVSLVGTAELVDDIDESILAAYVAKHNKPDSLLPNPNDPNNLQHFYRLVPSKVVLFDTLNFPEAPRQELII